MTDVTDVTDDVSEIHDMDEDGDAVAPASVAVAQAAASIADPPGVRKLFVDASDADLNAQLLDLREQRAELGAHVGHTREAQRERVDERVAWATRRIAALDREFAVALDRNPAVFPSPEHATMRMMAAPAWAQGVRAAIDAKPACLRPEDSPGARSPRPTHEQVSCYPEAELAATLAELAEQITQRETELTLRVSRRNTRRAQQAERELEASLVTPKKGRR